MADYPAVFVTAPLQQELQRSAPGVDIVIQPWHGAEAARQALIDGSTDLAISVFPSVEEKLHREEVFVEHYVVAMRAGHPAAADFNLNTWLKYSHIIVSGRGETRTSLDTELARLGSSRRVGAVVPNFQMVPALLQGSDMIAMLPSRVVADFTALISLPPRCRYPALPCTWHGICAMRRILSFDTLLIFLSNCFSDATRRYPTRNLGENVPDHSGYSDFCS